MQNFAYTSFLFPSRNVPLVTGSGFKGTSLSIFSFLNSCHFLKVNSSISAIASHHPGFVMISLPRNNLYSFLVSTVADATGLPWSTPHCEWFRWGSACFCHFSGEGTSPLLMLLCSIDYFLHFAQLPYVFVYHGSDWAWSYPPLCLSFLSEYTISVAAHRIVVSKSTFSYICVDTSKSSNACNSMPHLCDRKSL